jgi:hypothetical protein
LLKRAVEEPNRPLATKQLEKLRKAAAAMGEVADDA